MKTIISPSILAADFNILGEQIQEVEKSGAEYLHIDVMDGMFVPSISFGMPVIASIRKNSGLVFDVHLMIEEPIRYVEEFAGLGADSITFHLEAAGERIKETIDKIHALGCRVGLSIKPATPITALLPYLESVDMILIMTVEPGFGGQKYIQASTQKIKDLRGVLTEKGLPLDIQVDGGITAENIFEVTQAGANVIVAGSAVFRGNITQNIHLLRQNAQNPI
jgi:ribulose-phosphate 3-epimerase